MRLRVALIAATVLATAAGSAFAGMHVVSDVAGPPSLERAALPRWEPSSSAPAFTERQPTHRASRGTPPGRQATAAPRQPSASRGTGAPTSAPPSPTSATPVPTPTLASAWAAGAALPTLLANTGGGTQLITVVSDRADNADRDGTLTWWTQVGGTWVAQGSARARFGQNGLSDNRLEGDGTTPVGLFSLPMAFGAQPDPGTAMPWRAVGADSWWNENPLDLGYNTWQENCPPTSCWESGTYPRRASEHLIAHLPQYNYALQTGFNTGLIKVRPPARPSGSGLFVHVNGPGYDAGGVSVDQDSLIALLRWLDPADSPHIAIGNADSIYRQ
jgi:L,D-peptidoglycan transpeptidase YkuD (ErfK/YbiS/YcfS/YnhG family)